MYAKMRAGRGTASFDIAAEMTAGQIILGAKEKLLQEITERENPNLKYVWDVSRKLIPPYGIIENYQYLALIWNKNKIKKPEFWLDYWQAQKTYGEQIKGRVLSHGMSNYELAAYALIMGAKASGGDERHMDKAWDLLRGLKPYLGPVVDTSAAAVPCYMENQEVWIGPYWSARSVYYIKRGLPIDMTVPKEGTISLGTTPRCRSVRRTKSSPTSSSISASTPRSSAPFASNITSARVAPTYRTDRPISWKSR